MRLSELFQNLSAPRTDENSEGAAVLQKNLNIAKINRQILALMPGQTIQGEVVSKKGGEVQIKLADDMVLSAKLDREMALDIGKIMTFEVRNNGRALTLSPLFANTATDVNVMKALEMASLPVNEQSVEMTRNMMERGMSIDKNTIQNVYHAVTSHMDAAVRDIVLLHQLEVEVTPQNLNQLQNYQSMQHQLTGAMNQILGDFTALMTEKMQSDNPMQALDLFLKVQGVFSDSDRTAVFETVDTSLPLSNVLSADDLQKLPDSIQQLWGKETEQELSAHNEKLQEFFNRLTAGTATLGDLKEALEPKDFSRLLQEKISANWLIAPEKVQEKENMEKLYQRIQRQVSTMQKVLTEMPGMEQSNLAKSVTNMQNNLDFMNQLNQAFTYVQIPLQMNGKNTHGELYVYTNKKNLAKADGNVSAFLHLDMDNLGPVDVYVAMQNSKVNTKFYLADDEMIDFVSAHIHLLNERLARRGYTMNCEMVKREPEEAEKPMLTRMAEQDGGAGNLSVLGQYAFDVRA